MDRVIFLQLALAPIEPLPNFNNYTTLLSSPHKFKTHVVLGFIGPDVNKDPSVAGVFNIVPPLNGKWTLEIAVELPDLLPSIDEKSEAVVNIRANNSVARQLCLSNRVSRFHYQDGQVAYHALVPRVQQWHGAVQISGEGGKMLIAAEEQLRTIAAMRFQVEGDTTELAFESSIKKCLQTLFDSINIVLDATRDCAIGLTPTTRSVRFDGIPFVYVLISGSGEPQASRLMLNGARVFLYPVVYQGEQAARFRAIADGSTSLRDIERLIGEATSSWEDGEYEFAFLQAVIAAEIATTRAVRSECIRRGVSKNKLDDNRKEMTYAWALNIGLPLCFSPACRPKDALIAAMNAARSKRSDLMHEAAFESTREELHRLLDDTKEYIKALNRAEAFNISSMNSIASAAQVCNVGATDDQRRERAYFSWLNRGKPSGDDWTDWFEAREVQT